MLPIVLVLLVATSALALPSVLIEQVNANDIKPAKDNGQLVSSYITERSWDLQDSSSLNIGILNMQKIASDLADQPSRNSKVHAVGYVLTLIGGTAHSSPGDACVAANLINACTSGKGIRQALNSYIQQLASNIDVMATLANDPTSLRYSTGPRTGCSGGGKSYNFEKAWDSILASAKPYQIGLANEAYCVAKRMYCAFNTLSNNVGAAITAASLPIVQQVLNQSLEPVANAIRTILQGKNPRAASQAAEQAKRAIYEASSRLRV